MTHSINSVTIRFCFHPFSLLRQVPFLLIGIGCLGPPLFATGDTPQVNNPQHNDGFSKERLDLLIARAPFGAEPVTPEEIPQPIFAPPVKPIDWKPEFQVTSYLADKKSAWVGFRHVPTGETFILKPGEEGEYGLKLIRVAQSDPDSPKAVIIEAEKQGIMENLELPRRSGSPGQGKATGKSKRPSAKPAGRTLVPQPQSRSIPRSKPLSPKEAKAVDERLQGYAAEVLRMGLPSLPVPLRADQEKALLAEGVISHGGAIRPQVPNPRP